MSSFSLADLIGIVGVFQIVTGYFLLQVEKVTHNSLLYLCLNLSGASCILFSLFFEWNLSAALIEIFWIGITLFGFWKIIRKKQQKRVID
ncbi:MAG: hypothetical protein KTR29_06440 [Rhodothermaceae bacterium]|nr:hypothetical protein [Rhodothermaceae bacterium]